MTEAVIILVFVVIAVTILAATIMWRTRRAMDRNKLQTLTGVVRPKDESDPR